MRKVPNRPDYDAPNRLCAAIILADPRRHLGWPEPLSDGQVEESLMVRWAKNIQSQEEPE